MIALVCSYAFGRQEDLNVVNNGAYVCFSFSGGDSGV